MSSKQAVTPEQVLALTSPTEDFLCPLSANTYGIDFLSFKIRDVDSKETLFQVAKDPNAPPVQYPPDFDFNQLRSITYNFPKSFLDLKTIETTLVFKVGAQPVEGFRMIERHYDHEQKLLRSYDFDFMFCIPNSTNSSEATYDMPVLTTAQKNGMLSTKPGTSSDSFYFVGDQLIMHNKAFYNYQ